MITYLLIFIAVLIADIVWTVYISAIAKGKKLLASITSATVYVLTAFSFIEVVKDVVLLIPAVLGAFCGTYITLWWEELDPKDKNYHIFGNKLREVKELLFSK